MKKKGQAALEFLMTYGWAILVVLVVIGALAYFGVLNPSFLLPEKCTMGPGITCKDFNVDSTTDRITLSLLNGLGKDIVFTMVNATSSFTPQGCGNSSSEVWNITTRSPPNLIFSGEEFFVDITCSKGAFGINPTSSKQHWRVSLTYYQTESGPAFTHVAEGELTARVD